MLVSLLLLVCAGALAQQRDVRIGRKTQPGPPARLALVIGNGGYAQGRLANAVNDARDMKAALAWLGFTVLEYEDADLGKMERAIREFGDRLWQQQGVGLFYYAGHATQVEGRNYLVPVGSHIEREDEIRAQSVELDLVLRKMRSADSRTNIVILDACRNNPFRSFRRSGSLGLAQVTAPSGTIIAYATAPDSVASDEGGNNGLYTAHLLQALPTPGVPIEILFKQVRQRVLDASGGRQEPWESTSLRGDFYFVPPVAPRLECPEGSHLDGSRCVINIRMECPAGLEFVPGEGCAPRVLTVPVAAEVLPATRYRPAMLRIAAGIFWMGSPESEQGWLSDEVRHRVELSRSFWLAQTEVTQAQYEAVVGKKPSYFNGPAAAPVENVSWFDAVSYCNKLSEIEGIERCYDIKGDELRWNKQYGCAGYRLPTEAEWEYAARGGRDREIYSGSNDATQVAWFGADEGRTHLVKGMRPNSWGLFDMSGNVREWVWDWSGPYSSNLIKDPIGKASDPNFRYRVVRGGSWNYVARYQRVAARDRGLPTDRSNDLGFRPARSLPSLP